MYEAGPKALVSFDRVSSCQFLFGFSSPDYRTTSDLTTELLDHDHDHDLRLLSTTLTVVTMRAHWSGLRHRAHGTVVAVVTSMLQVAAVWEPLVAGTGEGTSRLAQLAQGVQESFRCHERKTQAQTWGQISFMGWLHWAEAGVPR